MEVLTEKVVVKMTNKIEKTLDKVKYILRTYPETRNNDNKLCQMYWQEFDKVESLNDLQYATPAEAIRRSRQLINAKGLLKATDKDVAFKRRQKAKEMTVGMTRV